MIPTSTDHDQATTLSEDDRPVRTSVFLTAAIEQFGTATVLHHRVRDISHNGMRVDNGEALREGATVVVTAGALEAVGATVVWIANGFAGLRFASSIDPDKARAKAIIQPKVMDSKGVFFAPLKENGPTAGWIGELRSPYRKGRSSAASLR